MKPASLFVVFFGLTNKMSNTRITAMAVPVKNSFRNGVLLTTDTITCSVRDIIQAGSDHLIRKNPMSEARKDALRLDFDRKVSLSK